MAFCEAECLPLGVFVGVAAYTWHDVNFTTLGYVWISIWYTFTIFEIVYVKKVVDSVKMTTWTRTYYQVSKTASTRVGRLVTWMSKIVAHIYI